MYILQSYGTPHFPTETLKLYDTINATVLLTYIITTQKTSRL